MVDVFDVARMGAVAAQQGDRFICRHDHFVDVVAVSMGVVGGRHFGGGGNTTPGRLFFLGFPLGARPASSGFLALGGGVLPS